MPCENCQQEPDECICAAVDKFFADNRDLMDKLAEKDEATPEAREAFAKAQPGASRCFACFFYHCRCAIGHSERNKRS